jgi:hypothetical protein
MRSTWPRAISVGTVLAAALATIGTAPTQAARPILTHKQVLHIALRVARSYGERHPRDILEAAGRLVIADEIFDEPEPGFPTPESPAMQKAETEIMNEEGGPNRLVDLFALRGHFVKKAKPDGFPGAEGRVLDLIVDAHTGVVDAQGLGEETPDLSRLGHVTRLR